MPIHDWTRVEDGIFHHFHNAWNNELSNALNGGLLPPEYYALTEQHAGLRIADVLTLHAPAPKESPPSEGDVAVAEAPPRVRRHLSISTVDRRRTLTIRHVSRHDIVAILEIVSPANKDRPENVSKLAGKIEEMLFHGIHVVLIDLFPPSGHDPLGIAGDVCQRLQADESLDVPVEKPLTLSSFEAGIDIQAYFEHVAVNDALPDMPLYYRQGRYVNVPLETSYQAAYRGLPAVWKEALEGLPP